MDGIITLNSQMDVDVDVTENTKQSFYVSYAANTSM